MVAECLRLDLFCLDIVVEDPFESRRRSAIVLLLRVLVLMLIHRVMLLVLLVQFVLHDDIMRDVLRSQHPELIHVEVALAAHCRRHLTPLLLHLRMLMLAFGLLKRPHWLLEGQAAPAIVIAVFVVVMTSVAGDYRPATCDHGCVGTPLVQVHESLLALVLGKHL